MEKLYRIENGELVEYVPPIIQERQEKRAHTLVETCKILKLGRNTVNGLLLAGKLKGVKAGRKWIIPDQAIDNFLSGN